MSARVEGFCIDLSLTCPRCRNPVPVNGLTEALACPHCTRALALPAGTWTDMFDREFLAEILALKKGEGRRRSMMSQVSLAGSLVHLAPRCEDCKEPVPVDQLDALAEAGGHRCGCGRFLAVRAAGDLARSVFPGARWVVGEALAGTDDGTGGAAQPVRFACMACGGSLSVDGSIRTVECGYCGASSFLPDALWQRFHPVPQVCDWFIVALLDKHDRWRIRVADDQQAVMLGRAKALPRDLFEHLARSSDWEHRQAVALNPHLPADLAEGLAGDEDSDVRQALALNPGLGAELLVRLAGDAHDDVREAVARRADIPPAVLGALVQDDDWEVRRAAVGNPAAPREALLRQAATETDRDVLQAYAGRADLDAAVLAALGRNSDRDAQAVAAAHPGTPPEVLVGLAEAWGEATLRALAENPSTPAGALRTLSRRDDSIGTNARYHPTLVAATARRRRLLLVGLGVGLVVLGCGGVAAAVVAMVFGFLPLR